MLRARDEIRSERRRRELLSLRILVIMKQLGSVDCGTACLPSRRYIVSQGIPYICHDVAHQDSQFMACSPGLTSPQTHIHSTPQRMDRACQDEFLQTRTNDSVFPLLNRSSAQILLSQGLDTVCPTGLEQQRHGIRHKPCRPAKTTGTLFQNPRSFRPLCFYWAVCTGAKVIEESDILIFSSLTLLSTCYHPSDLVNIVIRESNAEKGSTALTKTFQIPRRLLMWHSSYFAAALDLSSRQISSFWKYFCAEDWQEWIATTSASLLTWSGTHAHLENDELVHVRECVYLMYMPGLARALPP